MTVGMLDIERVRSADAFPFKRNFWKTMPTASVRFFVLAPRLRSLVPHVLQFMQFAQFLVHGHKSSIKNGKDFINRALILTFEFQAVATLVRDL